MRAVTSSRTLASELSQGGEASSASVRRASGVIPASRLSEARVTASSARRAASACRALVSSLRRLRASSGEEGGDGLPQRIQPCAGGGADHTQMGKAAPQLLRRESQGAVGLVDQADDPGGAGGLGHGGLILGVRRGGQEPSRRYAGLQGRSQAGAGPAALPRRMSRLRR